MGEISLPLVGNLVAFLIFPLIGGYIAHKLKLPSIIGYIIGGVILGLLMGDYVRGVTVTNLANIGVILLLFTVGLEIHMDSLRKSVKFVLIGGIAQIVFTSLAVIILSVMFGFPPGESVVIGLAFSLSSTAVIAKLLQDEGTEDTVFGELVLGVLLLQDLAVIPLMTILSSYGAAPTLIQSLAEIGISLLKASVVLATVFIFGRKIIPYLYRKVAGLSRELLNLFTIFMIFVIVGIFSSLGLSASIAAFIAGMLVGQTLEHYHVFSQIRPLRDLFTIFFFVYLGISINLGLISGSIATIVLFTLILIFLKFAIISIIFLLLRFHSRTSYFIGLYLANVGEFSFIILHQSQNNNLISETTFVTTITSVLLSIALAPIIIGQKHRIYAALKAGIKLTIPPLYLHIHEKADRDLTKVEGMKLHNHIILLGMGRVGLYIAEALRKLKVDFVIIDRDYHAVTKAKNEGYTAIYGDPTDIDILEYAQAATAKAIISTVPDKLSQEMIILNAKNLNPKAPVYSRVHHREHIRQMYKLGADAAIQPEFEAALTILKETLLKLGYSLAEIGKEFSYLKKLQNKGIESGKRSKLPESKSS